MHPAEDIQHSKPFPVRKKITSILGRRHIYHQERAGVQSCLEASAPLQLPLLYSIYVHFMESGVALTGRSVKDSMRNLYSLHMKI